MKLNYHFPDNLLGDITTNFCNLKCLSLDRGRLKISRHYLKLIFLNMTNLVQLTINCNKIDNAEDVYEENVTVGCLQKLEKISLYSFSECPEISLNNLAKLKNLKYINYQNFYNFEVLLVFD